MRPSSSGRLDDGPQGAKAGAQHLLGLDRLAQEVGDLDLQEPACQGVVEGIRQDDHGDAPAKTVDETLQGDKALAPLRSRWR